MHPLLMSMNDRQQKAIQQTEGPVLILAGAGSGKTRVVTHRVAYLIAEMGVAPWHILAITFTNKAAKEMKERTISLTAEGENVWISTFHAMCVSILRRHIEHLGYRSNFAILDDSDQLTLVKQILKDLNIDPKKMPPKYFLSRISEAKNEMKEPTDLMDDVFLADSMKTVYQKYQETLYRHNRLDFDDLLMLTVKLFKQNKEILEYYQTKFKYIHVDEYQDTNHTQYQLVKLLSDLHRNVCVVGDSDQSIYSWRGADISNILNFEKDYHDATVIKLEQNYRSTQTILDAANDVILNNPVGYEKRLFSELGTGSKVKAKSCFSASSEVEYVSSNIKRLVNSGKSHEDVVVLYRTNSQSRLFEQFFMRENIPYRLVGGLSYFKRKEIKDLVAFLRLVMDYSDDLSFDRVVNVPPRGIGKTTISRIAQTASMYNLSLFEALPTLIQQATGGVSAKLTNFYQLIATLNSQIEVTPLTAFIELVLKETEYISSLEAEATIEAKSRIENLEEFITMAQTFEKDQLPKLIAQEGLEHQLSEMTTREKLEILLADIALQTDVTTAEVEGEKVTLMTIHAAKGLEFDTVFLVGFEEGIFPLYSAIEEGGAALEEERRLAYVAITRAKQDLHLVNARSRQHLGRQSYNKPSRFITEIKHDRLDVLDTPTHSYTASNPSPFVLAAKNKQPQMSAVAPKVTISGGNAFSSGEKVSHGIFGDGVVVSTDGKFVTIAFSAEHGIKKLMAGHPALQKKA